MFCVDHALIRRNRHCLLKHSSAGFDAKITNKIYWLMWPKLG